MWDCRRRRHGAVCIVGGGGKYTYIRRRYTAACCCFGRRGTTYMFNSTDYRQNQTDCRGVRTYFRSRWRLVFNHSFIVVSQGSSRLISTSARAQELLIHQPAECPLRGQSDWPIGTPSATDTHKSINTRRRIGGPPAISSYIWIKIRVLWKLSLPERSVSMRKVKGEDKTIVQVRKIVKIN